MFKKYKDFSFFTLQLIYIFDFAFYTLLAVFIQSYKHSGLPLFRFVKSLLCPFIMRQEKADKLRVPSQDQISELTTTANSDDRAESLNIGGK